MKSLKVHFGVDGATLSLEELTSGLNDEIQAALINIGTMKGSDPLYPDRGTDLMSDAAKGAIVDLSSARHAANFAALFTLNFIRDTLPASMVESPDRITTLLLDTVDFNGSKLFLQLQGTTLGNTEFGVDTNLTSIY